jgi:hypothetical protein
VSAFLMETAWASLVLIIQQPLPQPGKEAHPPWGQGRAH